MTGLRVALIEPATLFGRECAQRILDRDPATDLRGFSAREDLLGELVEFGRHGVLVESLAELQPGQFDVVMLCESQSVEPARSLIEASSPEGRSPIRWILVDSDGSLVDQLADLVFFSRLQARVALAPASGTEVATDEVLVVPRPGLTCRLHLARALTQLEPRRMSSTTLTSASHHGTGGLDEMLDQARRLLAFSDLEEGILGGQLAFNVRAARCSDDSQAAASALAGTNLALHDQTLEVGAFHGLGSSVLIEFAEDVTTEQLHASLSSDDAFDVRERVELVDVAGSANLLVQLAGDGDSSARQHWLWLAADPLTRAGAWAAAELALGDVEPAN